MYSSENFERLFIRYMGKVYLRNKSLQSFCYWNNVPYNLFEKWCKDTRLKVVEVKVPVVLRRRKWKRQRKLFRRQKEEVVRVARICGLVYKQRTSVCPKAIP